MLDRIRKYLKFKKNVDINSPLNLETAPNDSDISKRLDINIESIKSIFHNARDMIFREINISNNTKAYVIFLQVLVDKSIINNYINSLVGIDLDLMKHEEKKFSEDIFSLIKSRIVNATEIIEVNTLTNIVDAILNGNGILLIDGFKKALILGGAKSICSRAIQEPGTEISIRGSREGFVENISMNISMLRSRIKNQNLKFETLYLGRETHTEVVISYIEGIADTKIIEEVTKRIRGIDVDALLESGYIEQYIDDNPFSIFATIGNTEKPDKAAAKLLEGRVLVLCDGTPFVLTIPYLFIEAFQTTEDYYIRPYFATISRWGRIMAYVCSIFVPAIFIAVETFHQEMIPTSLLISATSAREGIPFPVFIEVLLMIVIFEFLKETGIRMPRTIGPMISIVGALVIGESAVKAGLIGAPMVVVIGLTGITSFILPALYDSTIVFRILLILGSGTFGFYGIVVVGINILAHMCYLESFGVSFLSPFSPLNIKDLKDTIIRVPLNMMKTRPKSIARKNLRRQK